MITLGQAHETEVTLERAGATTEFWTRVAQNLELAKAVVALVMSTVFRLVVNVERDMTDWICLEPVDAEEGEFEPFLVEFLAEKEPYVGGEEMVKRAKEKNALTGLRHAEAMLRNQEKIPVEWRKYCLVFTEVWQFADGNRDVWCLYWDGEHWCLDYYWLSFSFISSYRLVGSRKYQKK